MSEFDHASLETLSAEMRKWAEYELLPASLRDLLRSAAGRLDPATETTNVLPEGSTTGDA